MTELWERILLSEERARIQANEKTSHTQRITSPQLRDNDREERIPQTFIFERSNFMNSFSRAEVLDIKDKAGLIEDIIIKSPSSEYGIDLTLDDNVVKFMHSWSELKDISQDIESVVATVRNGQYITGISNMHFAKNATFYISGKGITFTKIFAKVRYG